MQDGMAVVPVAIVRVAIRLVSMLVRRNASKHRTGALHTTLLLLMALIRTAPLLWQDATDATMVLIPDHAGPSAPVKRRRLSDTLSSLSTRLDEAHTCLSNSKDTDGDGTADCLDQCPYDPNAQDAKDCPVQLDVEEDPLKVS